MLILLILEQLVKSRKAKNKHLTINNYTIIGTSAFTSKCTCWTSCRCRWTSRKTKNNHRIPNAHHTSSSFVRRESRVSYRGIPSSNAYHGRICDSQEKPRLLNICRKHLLRVNLYCTIQEIQN